MKININQTPVAAEYVTGKELAEILSISVKTISNNTFKIAGRCKVGGAVRYHLPTIRRTLQQGKNLFAGGKK